MNKWLAVFLVLLVGAGYWLAPQYLDGLSSGPRLQVPENCQLNVGDCEVRLPSDALVQIYVEGEIRPLSEFRVFVKSEAVQPVSVSFEMVGMDMGINRYSFTKTPSGEWKTAVLLPVCTTDRSDWVAVFDFRLNNGDAYLLEFPFNAEGNTGSF